MNESYICQRILLTNDDGINAPGMAILERVASLLAPEVWVVAPERDQSGTSQSVSLHSPLRLFSYGSQRFGVSGTPADCVALACSELMKDSPPDLLLSGINRGANIGVETIFSGTVGAAMTGLLLGVPSIALSQFCPDKNNIPWETAETAAPNVIRTLMLAGWPDDVCLNINFPNVKPDQLQPLTVTKQGRGHLDGINAIAQTDPRKIPYFWLALQHLTHSDAEQTEMMALIKGAISVTPLRFDRTHEVCFNDLQQKIANNG